MRSVFPLAQVSIVRFTNSNELIVPEASPLGLIFAEKMNAVCLPSCTVWVCDVSNICGLAQILQCRLGCILFIVCRQEILN